MESCFLDALSQLDEFLLNPLLRSHSGSSPETSRNTRGEYHGAKKDSFQSDPHSEATISQRQSTKVVGPGDAHDRVTGVQEEIPYCSLELLQANRKIHVLQIKSSAIHH